MAASLRLTISVTRRGKAFLRLAKLGTLIAATGEQFLKKWKVSSLNGWRPRFWINPGRYSALFTCFRLVLLLIQHGLRGGLALRRAAPDFDRLRAALLRLGGLFHPDAQNAPVERGIDILLLGSERQGDRAIERAVAALLDMPVPLLPLHLLLLLAGEDQLIVIDAQLDILLIYPGSSTEMSKASLLSEIHLGRARPGPGRGEAIESPQHVLEIALHRPEGIWNEGPIVRPQVWSVPAA